MVKIKVTTLTEVIFYLKIEVPYFKKKTKKALLQILENQEV